MVVLSNFGFVPRWGYALPLCKYDHYLVHGSYMERLFQDVLHRHINGRWIEQPRLIASCYRYPASLFPWEN